MALADTRTMSLLAIVVAILSYLFIDPNLLGSSTSEHGGLVLRPNLYWGTRTRTALPIFTGLMWFADNNLDQVRHEANENDNMPSWGWQMHDGRTYGSQTLNDPRNGVALTTQVLHPLGNSSASPVLLSIQGHSSNDANSSTQVLSLLFYVSVQDETATVFATNADTSADTRSGTHGDFVVTASDPTWGDLSLVLPAAQEGTPTQSTQNKCITNHFTPIASRSDATLSPELANTHHVAFRIENNEDVWKVKEHVDEILAESARTAAQSAKKYLRLLSQNQNQDEIEQEVSRQLKEKIITLVPLLPNVVEDDDPNVFVIQRIVQVSIDSAASDLNSFDQQLMMLPQAVTDYVLKKHKNATEEQNDASTNVGEHDQTISQRVKATLLHAFHQLKQRILSSQPSPQQQEQQQQQQQQQQPPPQQPMSEIEKQSLIAHHAKTVFENPNALLSSAASRLRERFDRTFGFSTQNTKYNASVVAFARAALGNCLGSHGYFHGTVLASAAHEDTDTGKLTQPSDHMLKLRAGPLFTGMPSRSFFPRGFLWDEGFHQLLVSRWDASITRDVLVHWFGRMDADGWIAREQILGPEALSRVPAQFQLQRKQFANPPTLFLAAEDLLNRVDGLRFDPPASLHQPQLKSVGASIVRMSESELFELKKTKEGDKEKWMAFFRALYPSMLKQYKWMKRTQGASKGGTAGGRVKENGLLMRWRGRSNDGEHTLTSGIDDFPRGRGFYAPVEAHVDLLSWVAWSAALLARIATAIGGHAANDAAELTREHDMYVRAIELAHWNEDIGFYGDVGIVDAYYPLPQSVTEEPTYRQALIPHVGYIGLMPFLLCLMPADSPRLGKLLDHMRDENGLWSSYGLRSLAKRDPLYRTGEDYWRGKIWININYLALKALRHYAGASLASARVRQLAGETRALLAKNLVDNMYRQYIQDGFMFENYDPDTGKGTGTRPFTGWSALVVLIMSEE